MIIKIQISILMILLQMLIGCGEHLDVCNKKQESNETINTWDGDTNNIYEDRDEGHTMFFILSSYCPPCATNIVDNNDFLLSIKNKNVRFIGLFIENDTEKINKFIKRYNINIFDNIYSFDNKYITIRSNDKTSKFNKDNIRATPYHILVNDKTKEITTYEGMLSENDKTKINQMLTYDKTKINQMLTYEKLKKKLIEKDEWKEYKDIPEFWLYNSQTRSDLEQNKVAYYTCLNVSGRCDSLEDYKLL